MNSQDAIATLRKHSSDLRARGVRHAALFGSTARGSANSASDVDVMIELDPDSALDAFAYAGLKRHIAGLFGGPVDIVNRDALKPHLKRTALADAIYAF